ncbi:peptidoglycan-binding protein [Huaxiibacter chinensis]
MYQSHFNFNTLPFKKVTRAAGDFFVPYHQDVFNLLKEKTRQAGIVGLFSNDTSLLNQFSDALKAPASQAVNAFPKLGASSLLYKLHPTTKESKNRLQAVDAILRHWQDEKLKSKVLVISQIQAMKESALTVISMLLTRAQERDFRLSIVLMGSPEQEKGLLQQPGLAQSMHTHLTLRPLTCREYQHYVQMQCEAHGADTSPVTPARVRQMHALTKGHIGTFNELAHLSLLAAWTERAAQVSPRHVRLAAGEILPARKQTKRLAFAGLMASALFAACGWMLTPTLNAHLPVPLPVPVSWKQPAAKPHVAVVPEIENEMVNQPDAMHQLYVMWGYDASAEDALCQNAGRVNLMCKQGNAPVSALVNEGYPWVSELKTGNHLNYAVVARVGEKSLDLLMNNRTWQVSRNWFNQHATGNYTQLHRLTPEGKDAITAASDSKDVSWLDQQLSLALAQPETHSQNWTAEMMKRTREFQKKMNLHVDGIPGEETLMQLMLETHTTPGVLLQASRSSDMPSMEKKS